MTLSRREFLRRSGCSALSVGALASGIDRFGLVQAFAQGTSYRALVCIFLAGGNDGNNMLVPLDPAGYAAYAAARNTAGLAIAQGSLLPIEPKSIGTEFGLHPSLAAVHPFFTDGKLAIVTNVGPLIQPLSKQDYLSGAPRPYQLFSHADQISQWQTSISTGASGTGWGGRVADAFGVNASGYPLITALAGGIFTRGQLTSPLTVAPAPTALNRLLLLNGFGTAADEQARLTAMNYLRTIDRDPPLVAAASNVTQQALDIAKAFNVDPVVNTVFPNTTLGNQLKQVAKLMKFNLGSGVPALTRQIGSDHAWGSHHLVMRGSVIGGDFYGVSGPNGTVFPTLQLGGPDDTDTRGRWIPTTSVDQYAATLARWFGVDEININTVFPQLRNFSTRDLRFII